MRIVFVENHDSFSWNVIDQLPFDRSEVHVCQAHEAATLLSTADALVIGPGPHDPVQAGLVELVSLAAQRGLPTLGVCLGHQAIGQAFGALLSRSVPAHGHTALVHFSASRLLAGVIGPMPVMRYHSLSLTDVPAPLRVIARLDDGTVMAVEHEALPILGLQFHPDSFATPRGRELVAAFFGRVPRPRHPHVETRPAVTARPARAIRLSSLVDQDHCALLGPGFSPTGQWTLLTDLRRASQGPLVLARAEDTMPWRFSGRRETVELEFDVEPATLTPALDDRGYVQGVGAIREAIAKGDVYQVNFTVRAALGETTGAALLARLCATQTPRFAAWVKLGDDEFVSASPELLFELDGRHVRAEPMKGTAPAGQRAWLEASEKDVAELAMITDLLRNDLHQVCEPGSVDVPQARRFIDLPYVVQAVSDVTGLLRAGVTVDDVFRTLHPGGSVTGAPRSTALEAIASLEATPRGWYCGALALSDGESTRCALLIRTASRTQAGWVWGVGSGITWGSNAELELEEVRLKLGALTADTKANS